MEGHSISMAVDQHQKLLHGVDTLNIFHVNNVLPTEAHHKRGIVLHLLQETLNTRQSQGTIQW